MPIAVVMTLGLAAGATAGSYLKYRMMRKSLTKRVFGFLALWLSGPFVIQFFTMPFAAIAGVDLHAGEATFCFGSLIGYLNFKLKPKAEPVCKDAAPSTD
jgi:hypothetical protein